MRQADESYRKAIVGVDFSGFTELAIAAAVAFVPDGEIELVHAYHVPFSGFLSHSVSADDLHHAYQQDLSELIRKPAPGGRPTTAERGACRFRMSPVEGEVRTVLRDRVVDADADLLVLGSHGRSDLAPASGWAASPSISLCIRPATSSWSRGDG